MPLPVLLIGDAFTDTDGTLLTNHVIAPTNLPGGTWIPMLPVSANTATVQSNQANIGASNSSIVCESGQANVVIEVDAITSIRSQDGVIFRCVDNLNYWIFMLDDFGGANRLRLYKYVAGSGTQVDNVAFVFAAATTYHITITLSGNSITCDCAGTQITTVDAANNTGTKHGLQGHSGFRFDNFSVTGVYAPLAAGANHIFPYGDSKTAAVPGYIVDLLANLTTGTGNTWSETPARLAVVGRTIANAAIAAYTEVGTAVGVPQFVLINLGANDVLALPAEATFKGNLRTIINNMLLKWPLTTILMMQTWSRGEDADHNSLATWRTAIAAEYSRVGIGPDERVFLEGGDDGATYTSDGLHPNAAGYTLTATQWQTAMGY